MWALPSFNSLTCALLQVPSPSLGQPRQWFPNSAVHWTRRGLFKNTVALRDQISLLWRAAQASEVSRAAQVILMGLKVWEPLSDGTSF